MIFAENIWIDLMWGAAFVGGFFIFMLITAGIFAIWAHFRPQDFDGSGADEDGHYPEWYGPGGGY